MDENFVKTQYGKLRLAHIILCLGCILFQEAAGCHTRNHGLFEAVSSYGLVFSILIFIMFLVKFNQTMETIINLPLSLMINEIIICILFLLAGISMLMNLCTGGAKLFGILTGVLGICTGVSFGAAAKLSYEWFNSGSPTIEM